MKVLTKGADNLLATTHRRLGEDIPTQYQSDIGGLEGLKMSVKDMVEAHDGELREASGFWEQHLLPGVPDWNKEPALCNCQFAWTHADYLAWQGKGSSKGKQPGSASGDRGDTRIMISRILKRSASGDETYFACKAQIIGLGELFLFGGEQFTAKELYS